VSFPIELNFEHMQEKPEFRKMLLHEVRKLERRYDGIRHCQVIMELPYHHRYHGNPYQLKVSVSFANLEVVVSRAPCADGKFTDGLAMIRDAFAEVSQILNEACCSTQNVSKSVPLINRRFHMIRSTEEYPSH
jgi:hypothetical protein